MKTFKIFFLMAIPVVLLSCNSNPNRNNKDKNNMNESGMTVNNDTRDRNNTNAGTANTRTDNAVVVEKNNNSTANNSTANNSSANKDEDFVKDAASGGLKEVELAKFAQQHAQSQRVKNFAAMMIKDHSKANQELKTIASGKNITLPTTMENSDNKVVNDLQNEKGADFDRKYMKEMADDHEKDVDKFKKQAQDGTDPELKAFATKLLPVLIVHQDSAKSIRDAIK